MHVQWTSILYKNGYIAKKTKKVFCISVVFTLDNIYKHKRKCISYPYLSMDLLDELLKNVFLFFFLFFAKPRCVHLLSHCFKNEDGLYEIMMMTDARSIKDGRLYFLVVHLHDPSRI